MGIIKVKGPSGDIFKVKIAGDVATEAEKQAITERITAMAATQATAPTEEAEAPQIPLENVDYETGVQNAYFRKEFSKGDNEAERRARLAALGVPEEAIEIDTEGQFILNRDLLPDAVKKEYNISGEGLMSIDENSFSRYDWADFYGEARGPIIGGLLGALPMTG